jgi:hypothetical protein
MRRAVIGSMVVGALDETLAIWPTRGGSAR